MKRFVKNKKIMIYTESLNTLINEKIFKETERRNKNVTQYANI